MRLNTEMRVNRITDEVWEIPVTEKPGMVVPARIYATPGILQSMDRGVFDQVTNVACMPGITRYALCMPDGHWGYGFPIGGVAAFDLEKGVISPGGVGYDINCGVRLLASSLTKEEFMQKRKEVINELYKNIPAGVGKESEFKLTDIELNDVLNLGVNWALKKGYATKEDLERIEDNGCIEGADASMVYPRA